MKKFKFLIVILSSLSIAFSCSKEEDVFIDEIQSEVSESLEISKNSVELTYHDELQDLPLDVQNQMTMSHLILKSSSRKNKGESIMFGELITEKIAQQKTESGIASYSVALENLEQGLYYDNLALQETEDGSISSSIIRYRPNVNWYTNSYGKENRYNNYSGSIEVYDVNGNLDKSFELEEGIVIDGWANNQTSRCIREIKLLIGCAFSCFVSEIKITDTCTNGSTESGNQTIYLDGNEGAQTGGGTGGNNGGNGGGPRDDDGPSRADYRTVPIDSFTYPFPNCVSFEYASGLNGLVKGAATIGVNNTFVAYESISPTRTDINTTNIYYPFLFFTMPPNWTNGRAATVTAQAVNRSIDLTATWFYANPDASESQIERKWWQTLQAQMRLYGGGVTKYPLYDIPSPAPYVTSLISTGNCG